MKVIDAVWEKRNLGVNTIEIEIEDADIITEQRNLKNEIENLINKDKYQYYVLKFDAGNLGIYKIANELDFKFIEVQFDFLIDKKEFFKGDYSKISRFNKVITNEYADEIHYNNVISKINDGLFYTDRIALDPYFGNEQANIRYANWVKDLIGKDKYSVYISTVDNEQIGFQITRYDENECFGLLGGLFKDYQQSGWGLFLHYSNLLKAFEKCSAVKTSLSSNNIKVVKLWQYFSARMLKMRYVYVKHV